MANDSRLVYSTIKRTMAAQHVINAAKPRDGTTKPKKSKTQKDRQLELHVGFWNAGGVSQLTLNAIREHKWDLDGVLFSEACSAARIPPAAIRHDETFDYTAPAKKDTGSGAVAAFMR